MHFSPRQAEVIAALCKLQERTTRQDITYETLHQETGIGHVPRILSGIAGREKILIREPHKGKTTLALNTDSIVTTGLVASILRELYWATRSDHLKKDQFKKRLIENPLFQKARERKKHEESDEEYLEAVFDWALKTDPPYIYVGHEAKDRIGTTNRVLEEMDYLDRIAVPLEEASQ
jgi:hypothetical protein